MAHMPRRRVGFSSHPLLLPFFSCLVLFLAAASPATAGEAPLYAGSRSCAPCHPAEYESFSSHAKKSRSFRSIERLRKGLSPEDLEQCYSCHTTGYGKPGGFVSEEETPELKNAGCEVCHGPGSLHAAGQAPIPIPRPTREECAGCHTSERVRAFRFTPLIHGGGH